MKDKLERLKELQGNITSGEWYVNDFAGHQIICDNSFYDSNDICDSDVVGERHAKANAELMIMAPGLLNEKIASLESDLAKEEPEGVIADKQKYVVGFMFTNDCKSVVLIRKNKPAWQLGKLNGVGGKIETKENPANAMYREYKEETGVAFDKWDNFLTVEYKAAVVYFFKGFSSSCYNHSETKELEVIEKINLNNWPYDEVIPNLNWIVNLALDPFICHAEAMESYAKTKQIDRRKEITDADIKEWADKACLLPAVNDNGIRIDNKRMEALIEGAKAMRDGEIKHLNNL